MKKIGKIGFNLLLTTFVVCLAVAEVSAQAKSDTTKAGESELSLGLRYTESNNKTKILEASVKIKTEEATLGADGIAVHFYWGAEAPANLIGNLATDKNGLARLVLPQGEGQHLEHTFVVATEPTDQFDAISEEITVAESDFEMTLVEEDSVRQIVVSLKAPDANGELQPVAEAEVHLYVQRLFGLLPLSADPETTDENGEATVEFPGDIPGDTLGNVVIVARVEEHERFGNLEFGRKTPWGMTTVIDPHLNKRELWSSRANAPVYLIVIVNTMLIGIWGVILFIVFQAFRISKISRLHTPTSKPKHLG